MSTCAKAATALAADIAALAEADVVIGRILAETGMPSPRRREGGLAGLASIVVAQQVSTASAAAIGGRFTAAFPDCAADDLLAAPDAAFRACGLSRPKVRTLRAIAAAVTAGNLPLDRLHTMTADEAHAALCGVKGIGPWTADIYVMFCLGHPDAFPAGDLAIQEAARIAWGLPARPSAKALTAMAEAWRPRRAAVATLLWAFYARVRRRDGAPPAG
jgi:DNA-3-methyladenine glycosylase II